MSREIWNVEGEGQCKNPPDTRNKVQEHWTREIEKEVHVS